MDALQADSTLIRTPAVKDTTPTIKTPDNASNEPRIEIHTKGTEALPSERVKPYLTELLEMGDAYKHFNMTELTDEIDSYIKGESDDSLKSYKEKFDQIFKQVKAEGSVYDIIEQVSKWVKIQNKLKEALKEKEAFEAKDPLEMSSKELERWLKRQQKTSPNI